MAESSYFKLHTLHFRRTFGGTSCANKPNSYRCADPEIGVPARANRAKQSQLEVDRMNAKTLIRRWLWLFLRHYRPCETNPICGRAGGLVQTNPISGGTGWDGAWGTGVADGCTNKAKPGQDGTSGGAGPGGIVCEAKPIARLRISDCGLDTESRLDRLACALAPSACRGQNAQNKPNLRRAAYPSVTICYHSTIPVLGGRPRDADVSAGRRLDGGWRRQ